VPIKMTCPSCGKTLAAPDTAAGKKAKCPSCGQIMIVPEAVHEAEEVGTTGTEPAGVGSYSIDETLEAEPSPAGPTAPAQDSRRPCPMCGELIVATAAKCRFCGAIFDRRLSGVAGVHAHWKVPNYLVQAILVTLFCCLPGGIVAIVYAAQVNGKVQQGDIQGAMNASNNAKTWCWVSFGVGLVLILTNVIRVIGQNVGR
jgi:predicted RNA-binding Zn-ribbon protein involved in translation (DUF1610 family)